MMEVLSKSLSVSEVSTPDKEEPQGTKPTRRFKIKEKIGKGAYATVYRAEGTNGEIIAVKSIDTSGFSRDNLDSIMVEVQLLKKLDHPNIVKYQGFYKGPENVSIILEYCENGSLSNMCRKYGKIPEYLAAQYVEDVLEGLAYLHEQGIIHRDIKGANLLISAEGAIKLADFGVATSTKLDGNCTVVGTPHWMAPEIIEMKGALSATDIWSLGCTVVELLTGHPPYYDKPQMATAFAIVTDDQIPIPDGISENAVDFLHLCFIKEPQLRATAKRLLKHRWILSIKEEREKANSSIRYDEAVKSIKDWNDAIKQPNNATSRRKSTSRKQRVLSSNHNSSLHESQNDTGSIQPQSITQEPHHESWNEDFPDFPEDFSSKLKSYQKKSNHRKSRIPTPSLSASSTPSKWSSQAPDAVLAKDSPHREKNDEYNFSDLEGDIDVSKLAQLKKNRSDRSHRSSVSASTNSTKVDDILGSFRGRKASVTEDPFGTPSPKPAKSLQAYIETDEDDWTNDFDTKNSAHRGANNTTNSTGTANSSPETSNRNQNGRYSPPRSRQSSQDQEREKIPNNFTIRTNVSTLSNDSFDAEMEDAFDESSVNSEDQLNMRVLANANSQIQSIVKELRSVSSLPSTKVLSLLDSLVSILATDPQTHTSLAKSNPLVPLVQILQTYSEDENMITKTLDIISTFLETSPLLVQKFCLLGGAPSLLKLSDPSNPLIIRAKAVAIIGRLVDSGKFGVDVVLSNGGISQLAQMIKEDFEDSELSPLVETGIKGLYTVFKVQGQGLLSELGFQLSGYNFLGSLIFALGHYLRLRQVVSNKAVNEGTAAVVAKVNNLMGTIDKLLYIFAVISKMDDYVKESMLEESSLLVELFRLTRRMDNGQQVQILKFVASISSIPQGVSALYKASAFKYLVNMLNKSKSSPIPSQYSTLAELVFPIIQNMCVVPQLSKHNELIDFGAVPYLRDAAYPTSPLKEPAIDILFKMVTVRTTSSASRSLLRENILNLFLEYIVDSSDWQPSAYDAVSAWLEHDVETLEQALLENKGPKALVDGLSCASIGTVFDYFLKIVTLSTKICVAVADIGELWSIVQKRLQTDGPINRVVLLKIVRTILDNSQSRDTALVHCNENGVKRVIEILAERETTVLAKALSNDILQTYLSATKHSGDEQSYYISRANSISSIASIGSIESSINPTNGTNGFGVAVTTSQSHFNPTSERASGVSRAAKPFNITAAASTSSHRYHRSMAAGSKRMGPGVQT